MAADTFGKRLRMVRQDAGKSQIDLRDEVKAQGVKIGETYISELERTARMPTLKVAAAMARVLNVSLDYLGLLISDQVSYNRDAPPHYFSPEADEAAQLIDGMAPDQRGVTLTVVRSIAGGPNTRQQRQAEYERILDSIEVEMGADARARVDRIIRTHVALPRPTARKDM